MQGLSMHTAEGGASKQYVTMLTQFPGIRTIPPWLPWIRVRNSVNK